MKNSKTKKETRTNASVFSSVLKGVGISYIITCIIFIVYALLLTYTDVSEQYISLVAIICTAISCAVGGFVSALKMDNNGLLWGVITGVIYMAILFVINKLAGSEGGGVISKVTMLVCAMASGGVGGIVGINKK